MGFYREPWPTWILGLPDGTVVVHEVVRRAARRRNRC